MLHKRIVPPKCCGVSVPDTMYECELFSLASNLDSQLQKQRGEATGQWFSYYHMTRCADLGDGIDNKGTTDDKHCRSPSFCCDEQSPCRVSAHLFCQIPFTRRTAVRLPTPRVLKTGRHWKVTGRTGCGYQWFSTVPDSTFSWKQLGWGRTVLLDLRQKEAMNAIVINSRALITSLATQLSYCGICASFIWDQSILQLRFLPAPCCKRQ